MTTDTVAKTVAVSRDGWTIGGMAKGAGMLAPGLATMLVVITTDAVLDAAEAHALLRRATAHHLRPARLRRLHVDERPGDAARQRRERIRRPGRRGLHRGLR
jgi:hypothetical protein